MVLDKFIKDDDVGIFLCGEKRSKFYQMFECQTNKNTRFICVDWPYYIVVIE